MANKTQIKKYLENKSGEVLSKIKSEREKEVQKATDVFFEAYKRDFGEIRNKAIEISVEFDGLISTIDELGIAKLDKRHYSNPVYCFNELISELTISELNRHFTIQEVEKINQKYSSKYKDAKSEFKKLIAVTQTMSAKDGVSLLERLGFDLSELDKPKEVTTLTTNIDAVKLCLGMELVQ